MKYLTILAAILMVSCAAPSFTDLSALCDHKATLLPVEESVQVVDVTASLKLEIDKLRGEMQVIADSAKSKNPPTQKQIDELVVRLEPYGTKIALLTKDIESAELRAKLIAEENQLTELKNKFECVQSSSLYTMKETVCATKAGSIDEFMKCLPKEKVIKIGDPVISPEIDKTKEVTEAKDDGDAAKTEETLEASE